MNNLNGRINVLDSNIKHKSKLFKNIKTNDCCNYPEALTGTLECSMLSKAFFSQENMQIIQNSIRSNVYKQSDNRYIIAQQDPTNLKIIMRAIYLQYTRNNPNDITKQITNLNNLVVSHCIPKIMGEIESYLKYKNDISTLVVPIDRPVQTDFKYKSNEFKRFF